jgi:predicted DNA-binding transcriptional regulator YafY
MEILFVLLVLFFLFIGISDNTPKTKYNDNPSNSEKKEINKKEIPPLSKKEKNQIYSAIKKNTSLKIIYYSGSSPGESRKISPLYIIKENRSSMLIRAYCHKRKGERSFYTGRMEILETTKKKKKGKETENQVRSIKQMSMDGIGPKEIARKLSIPIKRVQSIKRKLKAGGINFPNASKSKI